jgi:hypothetical protein
MTADSLTATISAPGQMAIVANLSMDDEGATSHIEMRRALIGHYSHRQVP